MCFGILEMENRLVRHAYTPDLTLFLFLQQGFVRREALLGTRERVVDEEEVDVVWEFGRYINII